MNYSTGKKIVIASFAASMLVSLLSFALISFISSNEVLSLFNTVTSLISNVIPTVTALGFAVMYSYSNNKYNLALAIAAVFPFFSTLLAYVLPYTVLGSIIYLTFDACMYAVLPLAWALKWRSRAPIVSVVFVIFAIWHAVNPMLLTLPIVENAINYNTSFYITVIMAISCLYALVCIASAALERE